jgi:hypothetical protein
VPLPSSAPCAPIEPVTTTEAPLPISGSACCSANTQPLQLTAWTWSHASSVIPRSGANPPIPALMNSTSMRPSASPIAS